MHQKPGIGGYICLRMFTSIGILVGAVVLCVKGALGHSLEAWGAMTLWLFGAYAAFELLLPPPRVEGGKPDVSDHR